MLRVVIERLPGHEDLPLPEYATAGSSGMDLRAALREPLELLPGAIALLPTGLRLSIPEGYEGQIRPRSGLALKHGLTVLNSPGTIDADYRGEIKIILINLGPEKVTIERGERIAQLVVASVARVEWEVGSLPESRRGGGGFGHTGI